MKYFTREINRNLLIDGPENLEYTLSNSVTSKTQTVIKKHTKTDWNFINPTCYNLFKKCLIDLIKKNLELLACYLL